MFVWMGRLFVWFVCWWGGTFHSIGVVLSVPSQEGHGVGSVGGPRAVSHAEGLVGECRSSRCAIVTLSREPQRSQHTVTIPTSPSTERLYHYRIIISISLKQMKQKYKSTIMEKEYWSICCKCICPLCAECGRLYIAILARLDRTFFCNQKWDILI